MKSLDINYKVNPNQPLEKLLKISDTLKDKIHRKKPIEGDLWETIEEKLLIELTYFIKNNNRRKIWLFQELNIILLIMGICRY